MKAASVMLGRRNVCYGNEGLKTQQQSASSAIRSSHSLPHSLTHPSPSPSGLGGAGGSPVAQSPRAAIDTLLVLVVILVAVRAPLAV